MESWVGGRLPLKMYGELGRGRLSLEMNGELGGVRLPLEMYGELDSGTTVTRNVLRVG